MTAGEQTLRGSCYDQLRKNERWVFEAIKDRDYTDIRIAVRLKGHPNTTVARKSNDNVKESE